MDKADFLPSADGLIESRFMHCLFAFVSLFKH